MTAFTGTTGFDSADSTTGELLGFTGGSVADLQDGIGDFFNCDGGDDRVTGAAGNDVIAGGDGFDSLRGGDGNDSIYGYLIFDPTGSLVADSLFGGSGDDSVYGANGNDILSGDEGADFIDAGGGSDDITGGAGGDTTVGGEGDDTFFFQFLGEAVGDTIDGGSGIDLLYVTAVQDFASAAGISSIEAVDVSDTIGYFSGAQVNTGLAANLQLTSSQGLFSVTMGGETSIDLSGYDVSGFGTGVVFVDGDDDGETVIGSNAREQMRGKGGADVLEGRGGNDSLSDGAGIDILRGGSGDDTLQLAADGQNDTVHGDAGSNDYLFLGDATGGVSVIFGATAYAGTTSGGGLGAATFTGIERVTGSFFNDNIAGGAGAEGLFGTDGNDILSGNGGNDLLVGGIGNDQMAGGTGNDVYGDDVGDTISEGLNAGYDTVNTLRETYTLGANVERVNYVDMGNFVGIGNGLANRFQGNAGDDRFVDIAGGADIFSGGLGIDTVDFRTSATGAVLNFITNVHGAAAAGDSYAGIEKFLGSNTANDTMTMGGTGRALFVGGGGNDTLNGGVKNDQLIGQAGADTLRGNADRDSLQGGLNNDTMTGGADADVFVYSDQDAEFGDDVITDYQDGIDEFKLHSNVANDVTDFTITGNGTTNVLLTLIADPAHSIRVQGAAAITIGNADFVFY